MVKVRKLPLRLLPEFGEECTVGFSGCNGNRSDQEAGVIYVPGGPNPSSIFFRISR